MDIWKYNNLLREYQSDYINKDTDTDKLYQYIKKKYCRIQISLI